MSTIILNEGQERISEEFFKFLFSTDKEFILDAGGGYGKTTLVVNLLNKIIPQYLEMAQMMGIPAIYTSVQLTATTNKAAEVLADQVHMPVSTIHSYMNLKVQDNFRTGESEIVKTANFDIKQNTIIVIDEYSTVDAKLLKFILEGTLNCKILWVGDQHQLLGVNSSTLPILRPHVPVHSLTEPMRNKGVQHLIDLCADLKSAVDNKVQSPITLMSPFVNLVPNEAALIQLINDHFLDPNHNNAILTYTNKAAINYNKYIRQLRNLPDHFVVGEHVVNNRVVVRSDSIISVEEQLTITDLSPDVIEICVDDGLDIYLRIRYANLVSKHATYTSVPLVQDLIHFENVVNFYKSRKNWKMYFKLRNTYPDLRSKDAMTTYKAQGSSYDMVLMDMGDISSCNNTDTASRLIYVGASRARKQINLYGNVNPKQGYYQTLE